MASDEINFGMEYFDFECICLLIISCIIFYYICYVVISPLNYWKVHGVPYAPPTIFFGNIIDIVLCRKSMVEVFHILYNKFDGYDFGGVYEYTKPSLILRDENLIQQILIKDFSHFHDRGMQVDPVFEPLTMNLINLQGKQWRNLRWKLTPTFSSGKLKSMFEQIYNCSTELIEFIDKNMGTVNTFEAKNLGGRYTTNVIASCTFGLQFDSEKVAQFQLMVGKLFSSSQTIARLFMSMNYPKLSKWLKIKFVTQDVETYFIDLVRETVKYREENNLIRNDFLQLYMNLRKQEAEGKDMDADHEESYEEDLAVNQLHLATSSETTSGKTKLFTDECLAAQTFVFFLGGSESTSGTISTCLYTIARYPHIQQSVYDEINKVLKDHNGQWSYQAIKEMTFLDMVMQETFRMFPTSPFIVRRCTKAYTLPNTDVMIEPGVKILIPIYALHNDARYYPFPEKFDPERFVGNNYKPNGHYLPFGDGPRICIAMRFVLLEIKVCVAHIISRYQIKVNSRMVSPMKFKKGAMRLEPEGGMWIDFYKRDS